MTNIYNAIKEEWEKVNAAPRDESDPMKISEGAKHLETKARELDNRYADAINPFVDNYMNGLITGTELLDKMAAEAGKEIEV